MATRLSRRCVRVHAGFFAHRHRSAASNAARTGRMSIHLWRRSITFTFRQSERKQTPGKKARGQKGARPSDDGWPCVIGAESDSPMKLMADGKKLAKFWLQWSVIGICRYLMAPLSSKTFGKLGVTFTTYWRKKANERTKRVSPVVERFNGPAGSYADVVLVEGVAVPGILSVAEEEVRQDLDGEAGVGERVDGPLRRLDARHRGGRGRGAVERRGGRRGGRGRRVARVGQGLRLEAEPEPDGQAEAEAGAERPRPVVLVVRVLVGGLERRVGPLLLAVGRRARAERARPPAGRPVQRLSRRRGGRHPQMGSPVRRFGAARRRRRVVGHAPLRVLAAELLHAACNAKQTINTRSPIQAPSIVLTGG